MPKILIIFLCISFSDFIIAADKFYDKKPPIESFIIENYNEEKAKLYMDHAPLQLLEGIWHYPEEGVTMAIERLNSQHFSDKFRYRIIIIKSNDLSLIPGTVMGYVMSGAHKDKFYLWLYSERIGTTLMCPQRCVASIADGGSSISFHKPEYKFKFRVNFSRFLPTLFRGLSMSLEKNEETLPHGFKKIYPYADENETSSDEIRYL